MRGPLGGAAQVQLGGQPGGRGDASAATLAAVPTGIPQIVHGTYASQVDAPGQLYTAIKRVPEVLDKLLVRPPLK